MEANANVWIHFQRLVCKIQVKLEGERLAAGVHTATKTTVSISVAMKPRLLSTNAGDPERLD